MKKHVKIIYGFSLVLVLFMLILFHAHERSDEYVLNDERECSILTDYDVTSYDDESAPIGITQEYKWILRDIPARDGCITFYIIHQEIEIYIEDTLAYSLHAAEDNFFSKTVGCDWAKAYLSPDDEGKEIRILVHPIYESSIGNDLTIYYGNYDTICNHIVQSNLPILALGIVANVIGIVFIAFVVINRRNHDFDNSLALLGVFSVFTGLWKISDMPAAPLIFKDSLTLSALAIISIAMMVVPYIFFIRNQIAVASHRFWDAMCIGSNLVCIIIVLLQLTGIADLRQTLTLCHIMAIVCIILILIKLIQEMLHRKLSARLKMTIICCMLCLFGTIIDMIVYYSSGNSGGMVYCLLAFLIYVISMGYISLKEALSLIEQGKKAKHFEQLALHDELSGLYNRAFYAQYLEKHNLHQVDSFIIMFDVNNLKQCNDTFGHDFGDKLLQNSAKILEDAFLPEGKCIRMGGDEFCVVVRHTTEKFIQERLTKFEQLLKAFNENHPDEFPVNIAYGYANYDDENDFDFSDTLRRADKFMYQKKLNMKADVKCP